MSILSFLFILILIWIVPHLLRVFFFVNTVRKNTRRMYDQMYNGADRKTAQAPRRKPGWSDPVPRKKKIARDVGEYVRFQEISTTETASQQKTSSGDTRTSYTVEQQITDAEWEDLPS